MLGKCTLCEKTRNLYAVRQEGSIVHACAECKRAIAPSKQVSQSMYGNLFEHRKREAHRKTKWNTADNHPSVTGTTEDVTDDDDQAD